MLRRWRKGSRLAVPLGDAVRGVAACPCNVHQGSFVKSLAATDELFLRVMEPAGAAPVGTDVEGSADRIEVATAVNPEGSSFLYVFTDLAAAQASNPGARFIGVDTQVALRMSISNGNTGMLVTTAGPDDAWAAVTADGVARLLEPT